MNKVIKYDIFSTVNKTYQIIGGIHDEVQLQGEHETGYSRVYERE